MATLTIEFATPSPVPYGGFKVRYRPIGSTTYQTVVPNPVSSPVIISGLTAGAGYEGTISSDCGNGVESPGVAFIAYASNQIYTIYSSSLETICNNTPMPVYVENTNADIISGITVYTNASLTTPLSGVTYIMNQGGIIFNFSNGVVGTSTGQSCGTLAP